MLPYFNATPRAALVGRVWRPGIGPSVVAVRGNEVHDITSPAHPTLRDLIEREDAAARARSAPAEFLGNLAELAGISASGPRRSEMHLLAPIDLQACRVAIGTFSDGLAERVIAEKAEGDPALAGELRARFRKILGESLPRLRPGSDVAGRVSAVLKKEGCWSPQLAAGLDAQAEVFTRSQPLASVGFGGTLHADPSARWTQAEPGIVLAVTSTGKIAGATLGLDLVLRDIEGRAPHLRGQARERAAGFAMGPLIRLIDDDYGLDDIRKAEISFEVAGQDGFAVTERAGMKAILRDPEALVAQAMAPGHPCPDGMMLFLGGMCALEMARTGVPPVFGLRAGDRMALQEEALGELSVALDTGPAADCPLLALAAFMRNLSERNLI